jgi:FeS assembly SUF system protein
MTTNRDPNAVREEIVAAIRAIKDPEIPVNIYDLGLIYDIDIDDKCNVKVMMTLTTPNCPVADALPSSVKQKIKELDGTNDVSVELTWEPSWTPAMMSDEAKAAMDMMGIDAANPVPRTPFTGLSVGQTERHRGRNRA